MNERGEIDTRMMAVPISDERPWVVFGACRDADPELFFPTSRESIDKAISICASCPVQPECLDYALDAGERFGIWGGVTEKSRRNVRRRMRRTA
jgi:WhiB family redox-sensing transcriptional regulator